MVWGGKSRPFFLFSCVGQLQVTCSSLKWFFKAEPIREDASAVGFTPPGASARSVP
jgi:hypothetical protein